MLHLLLFALRFLSLSLIEYFSYGSPEISSSSGFFFCDARLWSFMEVCLLKGDQRMVDYTGEWCGDRLGVWRRELRSGWIRKDLKMRAVAGSFFVFLFLCVGFCWR